MKPVYSLRTAVIGGLLLFTASHTQAQMVGTDAFLQGQYVEIGITEHGSYGATTSPLGYHSHSLPTSTPGGPLGFVADPAMDGWTVGTPAFMGDYFYPGYPFEGWEVQIGPIRHQEFNLSPSTFGHNVSYTNSGGRISSTWEGTFDSVDIVQVTSIDTNNLYFTIKVTFTNTASAPKNDIYYLRTLDPDNDQSWLGGSFFTNNLINHQVRDTTVVTATGASTTLPTLSLGTTDTNATAFIYNAWPIDSTIDISACFNQTFGPATYAQGVNDPGDIAIGLIHYIPHLASVDSAGDSVFRTTAPAYLHPANQATITLFYAFRPDAVDSAITHINTVTTPPSLAVKNVNTAADIKVYPNPSKDVINVTNLNATDRLSLYDVMGKTITQNWQVTHQGVNTFSTGNIPAGAYILLVTDEHGNVRSRVPVRKM